MKKTISLILCLMLVITCFTGCGSSEKEQPAAESGQQAAPTVELATEPETVEGGITRGGVLTVAKTVALSTGNFDIVHTNFATGDGYVVSNIFDTLINVDDEGNFVSGLAESWEFTEDGTGLVMKLREDVSYSNGEKFNAEAAAKVLNWYISEECGHVNMKNDLKLIVGTDVVDEYTIQVNTSTPDAGLVTGLSNYGGMMIAPSNIDNGDLATNPIGTGPFMLETYVEGDHIKLVANPYYYEMGEDGQPLPYLDGIDYKFITDDTVKTTNLESGDVDGVDQHSSFTSVIKAQSIDGMATYQNPYVETFFITFNLDDERFDDLAVRQALSYAVDRQQIVDTVLEGFGVLAPFFAREGQWFYSDYAGIMEYNPEKCKEMLAEAGYPDGMTLELAVIAREPDQTVAQLVQSQMKAAGVNIEISAMERTSWVDYVSTQQAHEIAMAVMGNSGVDVNRQYTAPLNYLSKTHPIVVEITEDLGTAKAATDQNERYEIVTSFQERYLDEALQIILPQKPIYSSYKDTVHGINFFYYGSTDYEKVWMEG